MNIIKKILDNPPRAALGIQSTLDAIDIIHLAVKKIETEIKYHLEMGTRAPIWDILWAGHFRQVRKLSEARNKLLRVAGRWVTETTLNVLAVKTVMGILDAKAAQDARKTQEKKPEVVH